MRALSLSLTHTHALTLSHTFGQAAAYQDEHALLRDIVQRVGGIQAIQSNPDLEEKLDQLTLAQVLQGLLEIKDTHRPLGWSYAPRTSPTVGPYGGACP